MCVDVIKNDKITIIIIIIIKININIYKFIIDNYFNFKKWVKFKNKILKNYHLNSETNKVIILS